jgi:hypothetical protein
LLSYAKTLKTEPMHGYVLMRDIRPPSIPEILDDLEIEAPKTRADCIDGPRPCPWIRCEWHALWVLRSDRLLPLKQYTDEQIIDLISMMKHSCVMDICDMGEATLEITGEVLHTTRERVRQIEECDKISTDGNRFKAGALAKLRKPRAMRMLRPFRDYVCAEEGCVLHGD